MATYKVKDDKELIDILKKMGWKKVKNRGVLISPNKNLNFFNCIFKYEYNEKILNGKVDRDIYEPLLELPYSFPIEDSDETEYIFDIIDVIFDDVTNLLQIGNLFAINLNQGSI